MSQRTLFEEPNGVEAPPAIAADALQPWDVDDRQNVIHPTAVTYCRPLPFPKPVGAMGRTFRARVLAFIQQQGRKGATVADVAAGMGIDVPTARIRAEALHQAGQVIKGGRRADASGMLATVWIAAGGRGVAPAAEGLRNRI